MPIVWTIAGSDSGGGAGIQADLHTMQSLGVYGCSVITALTAQNSHAVLAVELTSPTMLRAQLQALQDDLPAAAIKLGMLGAVSVMEVIVEFLAGYSGYVVCDPVMVSTSGSKLLEDSAIDYLKQHLLPRADILTPNLPEAETLLNRKITTASAVEQAAQDLLKLGARTVLIKGGHGHGDYCQDYWTDGQQGVWLTTIRQPHSHNHGAGCTLSSALASCLALEYPMRDTLIIAKAYVNQGIRLAVPYGQGSGPVAHLGWPSDSQDLPAVSEVMLHE